METSTTPPGDSMLEVVTNRYASMTWAVRMAVNTRTARRVYYEPHPSVDAPKRKMWRVRLATDPVPPNSTLYCHITIEGEMLHSYEHIVHPYVGAYGSTRCRLCGDFRSSIIHEGGVYPDLSEYLKVDHTGGLMEIPPDVIAAKPIPVPERIGVVEV